MKKKKLTSVALAAAMAIATFGFSVPAKATEVTETNTDYVLTIPADFNVTEAGWKYAGNISVENNANFDTGKKITVSAASAHDFKLTKDNASTDYGDNYVGYQLCNIGDDNDKKGDPATSWEFSADQVKADGGEKYGIGVDVADYASKNLPAGEYKDTVTFTAKVEDAAPATVLSGALVDGATIKVNFKWRMRDIGDYVQGVYNAASGTFTPSKGGSDWGSDTRALYKVEKNGDNIIIGAGYYDYNAEGMVWTFNTTNDTYTYTQGSRVSSYPDRYGLVSVTLNGTNITSQLTKN